MWLRIASVLACLALAVGLAAASALPASVPPTGAGGSGTGSATAFVVRIVLPGGKVVGSPAVTAATSGGTDTAPSFSYPADGAVVVTGATSATALEKAARTVSARAGSTAANVSLFDGEITADSVFAHATAATGGGHAGGTFPGTGVTHLQALGRPHAFGRAALGDWGTLTIARHAVDRTSSPGIRAYDGISIGLDVQLSAAHGGLPAGTEIEVGYAQAGAQTALPGLAGPTPVPGDRPQLLPPPTGPLVGVPQVVAPPLTAGPYDFPVYGPATFTDHYGDTGENQTWQHGIDIFGELGEPLLAVADGTLYSIGWNHASGNRVWLRDRSGNQFLYSHLAAFSNAARNGARVRVGQVIGFMGDTGNTRGEPTHLHFEVHPVSSLFLGFDGAVDPGAYLTTWRKVANLAFPVETGWAPKVPGTIKAPQPGAVLLGGSDISTADGLDPAALRAALRPSGRQPSTRHG